MFFKLPPTYFFSFFAKIFDFLLIHLFSKGVKFSLEKKIRAKLQLEQVSKKYVTNNKNIDKCKKMLDN